MSLNKVDPETGNLSLIAGGTLYAEAPLGSILPFGGTVAPDSWMLCYGTAISRTTYAELFSVIGTSFGAGDGSTTFNIPDLRGEFLRGSGTNAHSGQGSGGAVGAHQNATSIPNVYYYGTGTNYVTIVGALETGNATNGVSNTDTLKSGTSAFYDCNGYSATRNNPISFTTRPTNTSVNYIIKVSKIGVPTDFSQDFKLSTIPISLSTTYIDANNRTLYLVKFNKLRMLENCVIKVGSGASSLVGTYQTVATLISENRPTRTIWAQLKNDNTSPDTFMDLQILPSGNINLRLRSEIGSYEYFWIPTITWNVK